ncbi:transmembrane protein 272-like [Sardina pilchardus]|uniref:transmembrane protein 272-like n=1 Tax=Sardina pilchardus TaxID=27697 RepID=UPI002E141513
MGVSSALQSICGVACCVLGLPVLVTLKLLVLVIPISEIVIGALYLDSCPIQRYIPIYLVVTGVFTLSLVLLTCLPGSQADDADAEEVNGICCICNCWNSIVCLFLTCWFIAGNVWIYSIYQPNYDPAAGPHCDKTAYLFAFWITTLSYIMAGVHIVGSCICKALH